MANVSCHWTEVNIFLGWPDICRPNQLMILTYVFITSYIRYQVTNDLALTQHMIHFDANQVQSKFHVVIRSSSSRHIIIISTFFKSEVIINETCTTLNFWVKKNRQKRKKCRLFQAHSHERVLRCNNLISRVDFIEKIHTLIVRQGQDSPIV